MKNADFQDCLLNSVEEGRLVLVETERFVHQLQRRYRRRQMDRGRDGWESPRVATFNRWSERLWERLWPDAWPASGFKRWRLLAECVGNLPPPDPLLPDVSLILALDESFGECLRYGIDPGAGAPANRLVEWRRSVWRLFSGELERNALFHPAGLAERLVRALSARPDLVREDMLICGFEFAGAWEKRLLQALSQRPGSAAVALPQGETVGEAVVFSDPEQEVAAVVEGLAAASNRFPLHELALAPFDSSVYFPIVSRTFQDVFGLPVEGENAGYNLPPDTPLTRQPLFGAAFLPLDFAVSGEDRMQLLALFRSPYYEVLAPHSRRLCQREWTWLEKNVERGFDGLMSVPEDSAPGIPPECDASLAAALRPLLEDVPRTAAAWAAVLERSWTSLGFPVLGNERDTIAWRSLRETLERFASEYSDALLGRSGFVEWIRAAGEKIAVEKTGFEDAGIQIMSGLESRGLAFGRFYAVGLVAGALPQPARPLPFLSPDERKRVQGGNAESQFEFGRHLFGQLCAVAPEIAASRPLMNREGEPCLPSPFWPAAREERRLPVVPWRHELPALQRARWVVQGIEGMSRAGAAFGAEGAGGADAAPAGEASRRAGGLSGYGRGVPGDFYCLRNPDSPAEVTVSELETILLCPSRYFFRNVLGLEELPDRVRGVDPSERGQVVHSIAAAFGRRFVVEPALAERSFEALLSELRDAVARRLADRSAAACWSVEERRLSGEGGEDRGLLGRWLELECGRFENGWRWIAVEQSFAGLAIEGCPITVRGRLDRLDFHPEVGLICWDYKTGKIPGGSEVREDLRFPQLPAYLLAVERGLAGGGAGRSAPAGAGYIDLGAAGRVRHVMLLGPGDASGIFLDGWEKEVSGVLGEFSRGRLTPRWLAKETGCEETCPYACLCGLAMSEG